MRLYVDLLFSFTCQKYPRRTSHLHLHLHRRQFRPRGAGSTPGPQLGKAPRLRPCLPLSPLVSVGLDELRAPRTSLENTVKPGGQFSVFLMISHRLSLKLMLGGVHLFQRRSEVTVRKREAAQGRMTKAGQGSVRSSPGNKQRPLPLRLSDSSLLCHKNLYFNWLKILMYYQWWRKYSDKSTNTLFNL